MSAQKKTKTRYEADDYFIFFYMTLVNLDTQFNSFIYLHLSHSHQEPYTHIPFICIERHFKLESMTNMTRYILSDGFNNWTWINLSKITAWTDWPPCLKRIMLLLFIGSYLNMDHHQQHTLGIPALDNQQIICCSRCSFLFFGFRPWFWPRIVQRIGLSLYITISKLGYIQID